MSLPALDSKSRQNIENRLREFGHLKPDWDGYGAPAPAAQAISGVLECLKHIPDGVAQPNPMVIGNGEVGLEWEDRETGIYIVGMFWDDYSAGGDSDRGYISWYFEPSDREVGDEELLVSDPSEIPSDVMTLIQAISTNPNAKHISDGLSGVDTFKARSKERFIAALADIIRDRRLFDVESKRFMLPNIVGIARKDADAGTRQYAMIAACALAYPNDYPGYMHADEWAQEIFAFEGDLAARLISDASRESCTRTV